MTSPIFKTSLGKDQNAINNMLIETKGFQTRDTDVFLIGYPKTGTTWAQEMIWLIVNNLNYEGAKVFVDERFPILELCGFYSNVKSVPECHRNSIEFAKQLKDPRCLKTHLKQEYLPEEILNQTEKAKVIYIARNPKDTCLSTYYYYKNILNVIDCSLEKFCDYFISGTNPYIGDYWNHVLYFWQRRNQPNVLFIKYEDMKCNLINVIRKVATFLQKSLTEDEETNLLNWLDFKSMKNNSAVNHDALYQKSGFMRSGQTDEHKKEMSEEIIKKFDSWIENSLKNTDYEM